MKAMMYRQLQLLALAVIVAVASASFYDYMPQEPRSDGATPGRVMPWDVYPKDRMASLSEETLVVPEGYTNLPEDPTYAVPSKRLELYKRSENYIELSFAWYALTSSSSYLFLLC